MMGLLEIRRMREDDIGEVWRIEQDLFTMPWSKASFLLEVSDSTSSYPIVGIQGGVIAGYAIAWFVKKELHIGNIAVARHEQGKGIGKQLLEHMLRKAQERNISYATLEVRVSNVRAINLYRKYGFKGIALRRHYYADNCEDALVMLAEIKQPGSGKEQGEARVAD